MRAPPIPRRIVGGVIEVFRDWAARFFALQGIDRAMALGAQAYTALIPLVIVYVAGLPRRERRSFADSLVRRFKLGGAAARSVEQAFAPPRTVTQSVTVIGVVLLIVSALAFTRALQRLYEDAYGERRLGVRGTPWDLTWLAVVAAAITLRPLVVDAIGGGAGAAIALVLNCAVWLVTPYLLLARRVAWQRLVPGALLTTFGMSALSAWSLVWMPRAVASSARQFGVIGVGFALLTWLVVAGGVLALGATGGALVDARRSGDRPPR
jgi:membrane protein